MALALLKFPGEVIVLIIEACGPLNFESLILTCKRIYNCGKSCGMTFARDFEAFKRDNGRMNLDLLSNPRVCLGYLCNRINKQNHNSKWYRIVDFNPIRALRAPPPDYHNPEEYGGHKWHLSMDDDSLRINSIKQCISESTCLRAAGADIRTWTRHILPYKAGVLDLDHIIFTSIFLMTLVPHAKTIVLPFGLDCSTEDPGSYPSSISQHPEVWKVLQAIRRENHKDPYGAPLKNLTRLYIYLEEDEVWGFPVDLLYPFFAIPNLTYLGTTNCITRQGSVYSYELPIPNMTSSLRNLDLYHCDMESTGISQVLSKLPNLTSLRYSHADNRDLEFDAGAFIAAIGKQAGHRLKDLAVTLQLVEEGTPTTGTVSMHEFTELETLELDYRVFYGPSLESGERRGDYPNSPKSGYSKWTAEAIPSLLRILPQSLQRFDLQVPKLCSQSESIDAYQHGLSRLLSDRDDIASDPPAERLLLPRLTHLGVWYQASDAGAPSKHKIMESDVWKYLEHYGVECQTDSSGKDEPRWVEDMNKGLNILEYNMNSTNESHITSLSRRCSYDELYG